MNRQSRLHGYAEIIATKPGDNKTIARAIRTVANLHDQLGSAMPWLFQGLSDTPLSLGNTPIIKPLPCTIQISHSGGLTFVQITLPQNRKPVTPKTGQLMTTNNPNSLDSLITHRLQSATDTTFSKAANAQIYEGIQTSHFSWPDANTFWRIQSSYDGKNFNEWSAPQQ